MMIIKNYISKSKTDIKDIDSNVYVLIFIHFLQSFADFSIALNLYFYLSLEFGSTDTETSFYFLLLFIIKKILSLPVGIVIDKIELSTKKLMIVSICLNFIATIGLSFSTSVHLILVFLYIPHTIGSLMLESILHINVGRYNIHNEDSKSISFTLMYLSMNFGAFISSNVISILPNINESFNKFQFLFTLSSISYLIAFSFTLFYRDPISVGCTKDEITLQSLLLVVKEKKIIRLSSIILILSFLASIYRFMELMMPKLLTREFNNINFPYGSYVSINELCILLFVPISMIFLKNYKDLYFLLIIGTSISGFSLLSIIIFPFNSSPNLISFFIIFTIGESIYSPKINQIIFNIADEHNRGVVNAYTSIMSSFSNIIAAIGSFLLLNEYCPQENNESFQCHKIWYWLFTISLVTPILLITFKNILDKNIYKKEKSNNNNNNTYLNNDSNNPKNNMIYLSNVYELQELKKQLDNFIYDTTDD